MMKNPRRTITAMIGAGVVIGSLALTGCTGGGDDGPDTLVAAVAGGTYGEALAETQLTPFEEATGIDVQLVEGGSNHNAQIQAQVASGNVQWDLVGCTPDEVTSMPDIYEPIDYSIVTATDDLVDGDSAKERYVLHDFEAFPLLAYNTDSVSSAPDGWASFFDVQDIPGERGVPDLGIKSAWALPVAALLADGVAPDALFPLDLDRAYSILDRLKPSITFYTEYAQGQDLLQSGDIAMAVLTDGRALQLKNGGAPVEVVWKDAVANHACIGVPKGAPNAANAMKFIQWYLENADSQAAFTKSTTYGPATNAGVAAATAAGVEDFTSLHVEDLVPQSDEMLSYVADNSQELLDRWNAFTQG
jgi:spermidine/putrescine-binding protein